MNDLPFEAFIAVRYLLARRKQAFVSLISLITVLGVAVGVMALLITLALMTGLQGELRDRIVGSQAHVFVVKAGGLVDSAAEVKRLLQVPNVIGAAPVVLGMGLAKGAGGNEFVSIKGIEPGLENTVTNVGRSMTQGSLDALTPAPDSMPGIVIGKDLARKLGATVDDTIEILVPEGTLTPFGMQPRTRVFKVVGIFSLGLLEFDATYGYMHIDVAQRLLDHAHPDYMEVRVTDLFKAKAVAESLPSVLGAEYGAEDWAEQNKSLFSALWLEKMGMSIAIGLIVMVAALNIIASLVLLVADKTRDIAILKTMGCSAATIRRIFMLQGLIIGLVGTISGAAVGAGLIFILDHYRLISIPIDVYQISHLPFHLLPFDFAVVIVSAVLICFVATIYPSRQAAKLDPAQALRYQ